MSHAESFIDCHQHFWDLSRNPYPWLQSEAVPFRYGDYSALKRDYLPLDFARDTAADAPIATVHIEAEWDRRSPVEETRWLTNLAESTGRPNACVAHAALDAPDVAELLALQAAFPLVRGIRYKPVTAGREQDARRGLPGSMDDPAWRAGYELLARHGFSYDLQAPWWHLRQASDLAADFPGTTLVLNHTGLPSDRSVEGLRKWRLALELLAVNPNTAIKVSGLGQTGQPWTAKANVPIIRDAISIFGTERCMFASNFPVDSLVTDYATILAGFREAIAFRPAHERHALLGGNAQRIYRLESVGPSGESNKCS
jgi:predicted TIM-barrel fold metal-dependent hydrolase